MEIGIIKAVQSISGPLLDTIFNFISLLGEEIVFLAIMPAIYWCFSKPMGEYILFSMLTSMGLNNGIKDVLKRPRPIGVEGIRSLRVKTATGYSFPSGHTQTAASMYGAAAVWIKNRYVSAAAMVLILAIGFSRVYLGVHYPSDVIFGAFFGITVAVVSYYLFKKIKNRPLLYLIAALVTTPFLLAGPSTDFIKALGSMYGFAAGTYLEARFVKFEMPKRFMLGMVRYVGGIAVALLIKEGLKLVFPAHMAFDFIRYVLLIISCTYLMPLAFKKFRI